MRVHRWIRAGTLGFCLLATAAVGAPPGEPPGLAGLAAELASEDGNTRRKAAETLGLHADPHAVRLLARAFEAESADAFGVKAACAEALGRIGLPEAAEPLERMLEDPDYWVRLKAAESLARVPGPRAEQALVRAAGRGDARVRARALVSLGQRGYRGPELEGALDDPDPRVVAAALEGLDEAGAPAAPDALARALDDDRWGVRLRAAALLARRGDPRGRRRLAEAIRTGRHAGAALREAACLDEAAIPFLVPLFEDPAVADGEREKILGAIEAVDCPASTAFFADLAGRPGASPEHRVRAAMVLYDRRGALTAGQVERVAGLLDEADPNLQAVALQVLLETGAAPYLPRVVPLAEHANDVVRHFALACVARYGGPEHEGLFIRALDDAKGATIRLALGALERLGTARALPALERVTGVRKYRRYAAAAIDAIRARQ